jgi:hypothetical protein
MLAAIRMKNYSNKYTTDRAFLVVLFSTTQDVANAVAQLT